MVTIPRLAADVVLPLPYRAPYDFARLRDFLATRALPGVERVDAQGYARWVACPTGHALIRVAPLAGAHALELRVSGAPAAAVERLAAVARRVFDVGADPATIGRSLAGDPLVGPLLRLRPGLRIPGAWDAFECTVRAVLGQQVSVAAGRTFAARLVQQAGVKIRGGGDGLTHLFPGAAELVAAKLGRLGLTRARAATLHALARAVLAGRVDFDAPPEDVVAALDAVPGIGPWTAQYVALRTLAAPDALPSGDLVLRRMAAPAGRASLTSRELDQRSLAWRPWRGYAVVHLWQAAADSAAQLNVAARHHGRTRARTAAARSPA